MAPHLNVYRTNLAGHHLLVFTDQPVFLVQSRIQGFVRRLKKGAAGGFLSIWMQAFEFALGFNVGNRNALQPGNIRPVRKLASQRTLDMKRVSTLSFDPVRVVGIHGPHQLPQGRSGGWMGGAGQAH